MRVWVFLVAWVLAWSSVAQPGKSKPKSPAEGVIVSLDDKELIVDLGSGQGLPAHARVKIYRRLDVIHPVTKQSLVDRFLIGEIELEEVGQKLSICRSWSELDRSPKPGDFAVFEPILSEPVSVSPVKITPEPPPSSQPAAAPTEPKDPAKEAAEIAFAASLGKPLTDRIQIWEEYLKLYPNSAFRDTVGKELVWLRQRLEEERRSQEQKKAPPAPKPEPSKPVALVARVSVPNVVELGTPLAVAVHIANPSLAAQVRLLVRKHGDPVYQTIPMQRDGDAYWRATLPQEWVEPGELEYFVEGVRVDSELQKLVGSAEYPAAVKIVDPPDDILDETGRSTSTSTVEVVDFKTGQIQDQYFRLTSDYRYRVGVGILDSFRLGVGVFKGTGGSIEELEAGQGTERNVNFGYAELEFGLHQYLGLSGRLLLGSQSIEVQEQVPLQSFLALRTELRVGEEQGTRLLVGTSLNRDIGNETWISLAFTVNDKTPMSGSVVLTDLPVGEDRGVSLQYSAGRQITSWCKAMATVGLNARTITHFGFTGGSSLVFDW